MSIENSTGDLVDSTHRFPATTALVGERIRVTGTVQGVGFRPTVWHLAKACQVVGEVWNDTEGVLIEAFGSTGDLDQLVQRIKSEAPPLARIHAVTRSPLPVPQPPPVDFRITPSHAGTASTEISADAATCMACLAEVNDPANRRYRYPFTNCTHCGPRLSIIRDIPYDRGNTTMSVFPLCPQCQAEYDNPADRRYHAQPNACPACGPTLWFEDADGTRLTPDEGCDPITLAADWLRAGHIVAIKGLGGFQLACDAGNAAAIGRLRQRKRRPAKPLALMAANLDSVRTYVSVNEQEAEALTSAAAPIVLLSRKGTGLPDNIAPKQTTLGFMLPNTPLHHLLLAELVHPIILTSGNPTAEPQIIDNEEARQKLTGIADAYLLHNRDIANRLDDSVARIFNQQVCLLRRARGFAPRPLTLPAGFPRDRAVLAMGAELKNTFCLAGNGRALVSQHQGDLVNRQTFEDFQHNLALYQRLFHIKPQTIAVDRHPDYLSTRTGHDMARQAGLELIEVQHHHAHITSVMVEHSLPLDTARVLGIALDGLGYGDDSSLWGGEFLLCDYRSYQRIGHLRPTPLPGGDKANQQPWRNTLAHLSQLPDWSALQTTYADLELVRAMTTPTATMLGTLIDRGINCPLTSSAGRLFDAVAAALGLHRESISFEGQAAMALESLAAQRFDQPGLAGFPFAIEEDVIDWKPFWRAVLAALHNQQPREVIAARFHHTVINAVTDMTTLLCEKHGCNSVILGGGVFQNRLLLEGVSARLKQEGLTVRAPRLYPANDGGISLGQMAIALASSRDH